MNTPITHSEIKDFGNKTGIVVSHKHPNRSERRNPKPQMKLPKYLVGGARTRPQYLFDWSGLNKHSA